MNVTERLKELGIIIPPPSVPVGKFQPVVQTGRQLYVSGQGSYYKDEIITGKTARDVSVERAKLGARYCALNILAALQNYTGDLNRIERVVKLLAFVSSDDDFIKQPSVVNGASEVFLDIWGKCGEHARSAIGVNVLPSNLAVEIEAIFLLKDGAE